ncbi:MAG: hypothetical protein ILP14_03315, partial [Oscillospiraceae bacterium]|nr:hypothetical protein [Oscillospiraceae bacterium]
MKIRNNKQRSFSIKKQLQYWFDNRISKGSLGFIRVLIALSVFLAIIMAALSILFGFQGDRNPLSVFWNSIATLINGYFPSFEDGSHGYVILMALTAIGGVLFTSVLIGIITSSLEQKIKRLNQGNSPVLEKNHIVVLGFYPGEYTLLKQLILAAGGKPGSIVIAENMEREKMEQCLHENLEIPKNFRVICRTADITDPASIEKCSFETCKTVIVNPTEDMKTIKAILAVSTILETKNIPDVSVNAILSKSEYQFPHAIAEANHITTLQVNNIIAKIIAHSCTQTGLAESFREVLRFEGSEFYLLDFQEGVGLSFAELLMRMNYGVPIGFYRNGKVLLNPPPDDKLQDSDKVLVFAEERSSAKLEDPHAQISAPQAQMIDPHKSTNTVIIGHNETLPIILNDLPENVAQVYLAGQNTTAEEQSGLHQIATKRHLRLDYYDRDLRSEANLIELAQMAKHIVILNNHAGEPEEADTEVIFLLLNLREIRKRFGYKFNITVEMQKEHNQKLVSRCDHTDFLVNSSMASLILAQLAENPELIDVFRELLSNEGNELYLKKMKKMNLKGTYTVRELRLSMLREGCI